MFAKRPQDLYLFVLIGYEVYSIVTYLHSEILPFSSPEPSVSFGHVVGETEGSVPDVRNFLTSVSACVVAFNTTAHAHMLILREGEGREFILMA